MFMKGHSIHHTILLYNEILHYFHTNHISMVFLRIDFRKAFDSLYWNLISDIFVKLCFTSKFLSLASHDTWFVFSGFIKWAMGPFLLAYQGSLAGWCFVSPHFPLCYAVERYPFASPSNNDIGSFKGCKCPTCISTTCRPTMLMIPI